MGARGPKPGFKQARAAAQAAAAPDAPVAASAVLKVESDSIAAPSVSPFERWPNPLRAGKRLDEMAGDELRAYAARVGVRPVDVQALTEDRLRQNCALKLREIVESLTE